MWLAIFLYVAAGLIIAANGALILLGGIVMYQTHGGAALGAAFNPLHVTNYLIPILSFVPAAALIYWGRKLQAEAEAERDEA